MSGGPEKVDHRGKFSCLPHQLIDSVAWRYATGRERSVLIAIQRSHNGFNNGRIAITIEEIGVRGGNQSHGLNAKAVCGLIEKGFLECTSGANHHQAKAREYRLTFISATRARGKGTEPATNEYLSWRPERKTRKFGAEEYAARRADPAEASSAQLKVCAEETALGPTESCDIEGAPRGEETSAHIGNQSPHPIMPVLASSPTVTSSVEVDLLTLRAWTEAVIRILGFGGARVLAQRSGAPEGTFSRFRAGKNLPPQYRLRLQEACARQVPFIDIKREEASTGP